MQDLIPVTEIYSITIYVNPSQSVFIFITVIAVTLSSTVNFVNYLSWFLIDCLDLKKLQMVMVVTPAVIDKP